jgi:hypothetical protein
MMASANELQDEIVTTMRGLLPQTLTQTHSRMADGLEGFARAHQIAMNMDAMAKAGTLDLLRHGSEFQSEIKKYRVPGEVCLHNSAKQADG